jgi:DNA-binding response OmpR family regulator
MDDSAFALDLLRTALVDNGVVVTCGRDLGDLVRLKGAEFDLVLMDVDMPEAFGDDVTSWLLTEGLNTPVYLLSSIPEEQLARRAEECGARGFIWKCIGIEAVIARVHALLSSDVTSSSRAPSRLVDSFVSVATGRLRRAEAAITDGALSTVASELHTLAGDAGLLGLDHLAELAEACRAQATASSGDSVLEVAIALRTSLAAVASELENAGSRARVPVVPVSTEHAGRLLLLDDSDLYRSTLMGLLEDAGYEVVEARRLSEARHRMRDRHYDLAILDLQLEDGSGSDLIPELREHAPRTRLLLLSGNEQQVHAADLMLPKSVDPAELLRRIDELLSNA